MDKNDIYKKKQNLANSFKVPRSNNSNKKNQDKLKTLKIDTSVIEGPTPGTLRLDGYVNILNFFCNEVKEGRFNGSLCDIAIVAAHTLERQKALNEALNELLDQWREQFENDQLDSFAVRDFQRAIHKHNDATISERIKQLVTEANIKQIGHIFISYSNKNRDYVLGLEDYLKLEGFSVWFDDSIDYGADWMESIKKNIRKCSIMIVIMTPESEKTDWVTNEFLYAKNIKKPIVPLLLSGECFFYLLNLQHFDVTDGQLPPIPFIERLKEIC